MRTDYLNQPVDHVRIEAEARRLRAEAVAESFGALKRWVAAPFHRRSVI